jgi:polyribonucleotide nucleotidyltransferase
MMDFGAFVKIGPNQDGMVHVSEVAPFRIGNIADALQVGDVVPVVIKEIDDKGRYNLSIKAADPEFAARKGIKPDEGNGGSNHGGRENRHNDRGERPRRY